jgi:hypothetical protein
LPVSASRTSLILVAGLRSLRTGYQRDLCGGTLTVAWLAKGEDMEVLPRRICVVDKLGRPVVPARHYERIDAGSDDAKDLSEADWDKIILQHVSVLADALREAGVIAEDSTLRPLGTQYGARSTSSSWSRRWTLTIENGGESDFRCLWRRAACLGAPR